MQQGRSLQPLITRLNEIRREHPALQRIKGTWFHGISNDNLLCYSRRDPVTGDTVLVVVCLDPQSQQWGQTDLWMPALGLAWGDSMEVVDELSGEVYQWGQYNSVGLDPHWRAAHILRVRRAMTAFMTGRAPTAHDQDPLPRAGCQRVPARPADDRRTPSGTSARSSTRFWSGPSRTRTATAPATCAG